MSHLPNETIDKVGEVVFNSRENNPIKLKKMENQVNIIKKLLIHQILKVLLWFLGV